MLKDAGNHGPDQDKDGGLLDTGLLPEGALRRWAWGGLITQSAGDGEPGPVKTATCREDRQRTGNATGMQSGLQVEKSINN